MNGFLRTFVVTESHSSLRDLQKWERHIGGRVGKWWFRDEHRVGVVSYVGLRIRYCFAHYRSSPRVYPIFIPSEGFTTYMQTSFLTLVSLSC